MNPALSQRLTEVAALFFRLGATAFGGPVAHIAMMHDETVTRRGWLDRVNVSSLGLMAAVTWQLGRASLTGPLAILSACVSLLLLTRFRINSIWLILGGALLGLAQMVFR